MVERNHHFPKLVAGYIFPEIQRRKNALLEKNPEAHILNLGIGDTTQPLVPHVVGCLEKAAKDLGERATYRGYGSEQGDLILREKIARVLYSSRVHPEDIFISDGAKCDVGRIQLMFGSECSIAVQDPTYPVYVDTSVIVGQTGDFDRAKKQYQGIQYMPCLPENDFFPDLSQVKRTDLIYICSPNNPTGAVATREQLEELVAFAKKNRSIILFDSAYAAYIQEAHLPRSIYEIEGAKEVAIEIGSFSKLAGFTGVRLGWSVIPKELCFDDGTQVKSDYSRMHATFFNGASNIAQRGGRAILEEEGLIEIAAVLRYYHNNAKKLRDAFEAQGIVVYGAHNAPYVWVRYPGFESSWEAFEALLDNSHIVTVPGSAFGPGGEGFLRFSGLGHSKDVEEAARRLTANILVST